MGISVDCRWLDESFSCRKGKVQISVVAYEHPAGIPARFCAGLLPAAALSKQLMNHGAEPIVRLVDPSPIANYCNGWNIIEPQFQSVLGGFLDEHKISYFFDQAEQVTDNTLEILNEVGRELETSDDPEIIGMVERIKESGRKHGGESGANNAIVYMAAHPFSWLDMYHPMVWGRKYKNTGCFVNLMSKPESRFALIRQYLKDQRPDLSSGIGPIDRYMTICNTPCYIPLAGEPLFDDLVSHGYEWCHERYLKMKGVSTNHRRACKDFESLMSYSD